MLEMFHHLFFVILLTLLIGVLKSYELTALETKITSGEKLLIFSDDFDFGFL